MAAVSIRVTGGMMRTAHFVGRVRVWGFAANPWSALPLKPKFARPVRSGKQCTLSVGGSLEVVANRGLGKAALSVRYAILEKGCALFVCFCCGVHLTGFNHTRCCIYSPDFVPANLSAI